jgi:hypothetical protein
MSHNTIPCLPSVTACFRTDLTCALLHIRMLSIVVLYWHQNQLQSLSAQEQTASCEISGFLNCEGFHLLVILESSQYSLWDLSASAHREGNGTSSTDSCQVFTACDIRKEKIAPKITILLNKLTL